jgi:hypothetical protein
MVALALLTSLGLVVWLLLAVLVPFVASPAMLARLGPFRAGLLGVAICSVLAVLAFLILDLDHIPLADDPRGRFWEAVQLAGASAIFWLPIYLFGLSRQLRRRGAP